MWGIYKKIYDAKCSLRKRVDVKAFYGMGNALRVIVLCGFAGVKRQIFKRILYSGAYRFRNIDMRHLYFKF